METEDLKISQNLFQPIRPERISEKIADQIRNAITSGTFKIGDRLPSERELSERMGVSRPSVREAIQKLEMLGMIETIHGGGSLVRNFTEQTFRNPIELLLESDPRKVIELTEVRACMEIWACKKAAENRTDSELQLIRDLLQQMEYDLNSGTISADVDFKFHAEIAAAAHNTVFLHLMHSIFELINHSVKMAREKVFLANVDQRKILDHHRRVYEAIEKMDPVAAEFAMSEHLLFVIEEYKKRFLLD